MMYLGNQTVGINSDLKRNELPNWQYINTITINEEASRISCNTDASGQPFSLKGAVIFIYSAVSSQVTTNVNIKCGFSPYANGTSANYEIVTITAGIRTTAQQNMAWMEIEGIINDHRSNTSEIPSDNKKTILCSGGSISYPQTKFAIETGEAANDGYIHAVYVDGNYFGPGSFIRVYGIRA